MFGEFLDAGAIGVIVLINAVIGFVQEDRAERAIRALPSMTAPKALRDAQIREPALGVLALIEKWRVGVGPGAGKG